MMDSAGTMSNVIAKALTLHVGGVSISLYDATCNLGVTMDSTGTMSYVMAKAQTLHVTFKLAESVYLPMMLRVILGP